MHKWTPAPDRSIHDFLAYDAASGAFTWIAAQKFAHAVVIGARAGTVRPTGYRQVKFNGVHYRTGRLAWWFAYGEWLPADIEIDHRNRDRSNDAIGNLRKATRAQNAANRRCRKHTSVHKGVSRYVKCDAWQAAVHVDGHSRWLGVFYTEEAAARAYDAAAIVAFGEFAVTNYPQASDV